MKMTGCYRAGLMANWVLHSTAYCSVGSCTSTMMSWRMLVPSSFLTSYLPGVTASALKNRCGRKPCRQPGGLASPANKPILVFFIRSKSFLKECRLFESVILFCSLCYSSICQPYVWKINSVADPGDIYLSQSLQSDHV